MDPRIHDEVERRKDPRGSRHERVVGNRRWAGELREVAAANDSYCGGSSNHRGVGSGDGSHHDEGCSHARAVAHGRSSRQRVGSRRLDEKVEASENGSGRCGGLRLGSVDGLSRRAGRYFQNWKLTSDTQRTLAPLKS